MQFLSKSASLQYKLKSLLKGSPVDETLISICKIHNERKYFSHILGLNVCWQYDISNFFHFEKIMDNFHNEMHPQG